MNVEKMQKKFPSYFHEEANIHNIDIPPKDSVSAPPISVYRACPTNKIEKESFLNSYEENGFKVLKGLEGNPSAYSMSVYTEKKYLKRFTTINNPYKNPLKIAKGTLSPEIGVWKQGKGGHVDFWQYEGANVHNHFGLEE